MNLLQRAPPKGKNLNILVPNFFIKCARDSAPVVIFAKCVDMISSWCFVEPFANNHITFQVLCDVI